MFPTGIGFGFVKRELAVCLEIKVFPVRFPGRPAIVGLPDIGSRLESDGFCKIPISLSFQVPGKPAGLDLFSEIYARFRAETDIAQAIAGAASPSAMVPGAYHDVIIVMSVLLF